MLRIEVTDLDTGKVTEYDYSRSNWANRWACMRDGGVHMWAPHQLRQSPNLITSGRRWRVIKYV